MRAPNWLGDTVMALPALRALRAWLPDAHIAITGRWAPLLAGQGVGDLMLPYPGAGAERRRFDRALRGFAPDLAIVFPNSFEAALAARRWRARRVVGFDTDARRLLLTDAPPLPSPRRHQVDEYALLVEVLGAPAVSAAPDWRLAADLRGDQVIDGLLGEAGLDGLRPIVGLHVGTALARSKQWPPAAFAALADRLDAAAFAPVLLGSSADAAIAAEIAAGSARAPASLVGRDHPALLPRLLSRLGCLVSGDTGVAHLAAALGVPTITLFGPTDPRLTAPRAPRARTVSHAVPCSPCFLATCPIEHPCLTGIGAAEVEAHVRSVAA